MRYGSAMTDKQIGRAACDGRKLRFQTSVGSIRGYVVGADDYHWLVAQDGPFLLHLVHKTAPFVTFMNEYLKEEGDQLRKMIQDVGRPFWEYCARTYVGHSAPNDEEPQK